MNESQYIDVREPAEFASEKIAGSQLVPLSQWDELSDSLDKDKPLLLVCRTGNRAKQALVSLEKKGFSNVKILEGGLEAWKAAGRPVEKGSRRVWAMDRQVRFTAGSLVLMGLVGFALVHPAFIVLTAFVGAGLVFSALTDSCGMAMVLCRMPWNQ